MKTRKIGIGISCVLAACLLGGAAVKLLQPGQDMTHAANKFLKALNDEQRKTAVLKYDDASRVAWHFIPKGKRKGFQVKNMSKDQRTAALALMRAALSQTGYDKAVVIMELESILFELQKGRKGAIRDAERYYFTIFGSPTADSKWGLSVEGHHLSLNFVVDKNKMVGHTPAFYGANPGLVKKGVGVGPKQGTQVLKNEEMLGFKLLASLNDEQRKVAVIAAKAPRDLRDAGKAQAPTAPPVGLAAAKMSKDQVAILQALIETHANNMPKPIADARLAEIEKAGIGKVQFAWAGASKPGIGHYYRIEGPTFQIELCNTQADGAGNPANHIHAMWRDTRGDFGIAVK
jgi:hypothetical protein